MKILKKLNHPVAWILLTICLLGASDIIIKETFDQIKIRKNPAITLPNGDTISNPSSGLITTIGVIHAPSFITDTSCLPSHTWYVSPTYTFSKYRKLSPSIKMALDSLGTDSATIYVYDGIYTDLITAHTNVAIIGNSQDRTIISRSDTNVIFANGIKNFSLSNMTIQNAYTVAGSKVIGVCVS